MEDDQFEKLQRSINEATEHAQGERDLETTEVESNSPASGEVASCVQGDD